MLLSLLLHENALKVVAFLDVDVAEDLGLRELRGLLFGEDQQRVELADRLLSGDSVAQSEEAHFALRAELPLCSQINEML